MSYQHGRFVWFECFTENIERARSFYTELFDWTIDPMPMEDGQPYQLIKSGRTGIGGLMPLQGEQGNQPFWLSYLSVNDVDRVTDRIVDQDGELLHAAFDVAGVGRRAVVQDPQGAVFALFKGERGDPEEAEGPGSWWWNELWTSEELEALDFYESVFDYSHDEMSMDGDGTYYVLMQGDAPRGGLMRSPDVKTPPNWLPYVRVADCDATAVRAKSMGAKVLWSPSDIPSVGRAMVLSDPTGAVIAAITPAN